MTLPATGSFFDDDREHVAYGLGIAKLFGAWEDAGGKTWLFLEYLDGARSAAKKNPEEMLPAAARWAGRFHAVAAEPSSVFDRRGLKVYDAAYYRRWARRATQLAGDEQREFSWLAEVCRRAEPLLGALPDGTSRSSTASSPRTTSWRATV